MVFIYDSLKSFEKGFFFFLFSACHTYTHNEKKKFFFITIFLLYTKKNLIEDKIGK